MWLRLSLLKHWFYAHALFKSQVFAIGPSDIATVKRLEALFHMEWRANVCRERPIVCHSCDRQVYVPCAQAAQPRASRCLHNITQSLRFVFPQPQASSLKHCPPFRRRGRPLATVSSAEHLWPHQVAAGLARFRRDQPQGQFLAPHQAASTLYRPQ